MVTQGTIQDIPSLAKAHQYILKARLSVQGRKRKLEERGQTTGHDWLLNSLQSLERQIEREIASEWHNHFLYPSLSRIKGAGDELLPKLIGYIEAVSREEDGVHGIACFDTLSQLWTFTGYGLPQHKEAGEKLHYNPELKSLLWKLGDSFIKHQNQFVQKVYSPTREAEAKKFSQVVPAVRGQLKNLPPDVTTLGHIDARARRKMAKVFLGCLYYKWRELLNLSCRPTYAEEKLGHTTRYSIEDFWDR